MCFPAMHECRTVAHWGNMFAEYTVPHGDKIYLDIYEFVPCMNDDEPSGRDNKLCSQLKSLRVTFEMPHTSIMPPERGKISSR